MPSSVTHTTQPAARSSIPVPVRTVFSRFGLSLSMRRSRRMIRIHPRGFGLPRSARFRVFVCGPPGGSTRRRSGAGHHCQQPARFTRARAPAGATAIPRARRPTTPRHPMPVRPASRPEDPSGGHHTATWRTAAARVAAASACSAFDRRKEIVPVSKLIY